MHPHEIIERMELVLLRAIYLEAKFKPLAKDTENIRRLGGSVSADEVFFEFKLINPKESNLPFERQRELLLRMDRDKTIQLYWDQGVDNNWDVLKQYSMSIQLGFLEKRYVLLASKFPDSKSFLWYKAPDADDVILSSDEKAGFSLEGVYEVGPIKAVDGVLFRNNRVWKLVDRFKFILIYLMKNRGFRSYRGIFHDMYPNRREAKRSITNIGSYVSDLRKVLPDELDIVQSKRYDPKDANDGPVSGCELVLKKKAKR